MAITSWPFDGQTVTETQFSQWAHMLHTSGVNSADAFKVTADSSGMKVTSAAGLALVRGHAAEDTVAEDLTIQPADAAARIDLVVLELDPSLTVPATLVRKVVKGTPGAGVPALTQTVGGLFQFPLAQVAVAAGVVTIASGNVTDQRVLLDPPFTMDDITDATVTGKAVVRAASAAAARTAIDAQVAGSYAAAVHSHAAADVTSGTLADARIPSLNASKVTAGTFAAARIPNAMNLDGISYGTADPSGGVDGDIYFKLV